MRKFCIYLFLIWFVISCNNDSKKIELKAESKKENIADGSNISSNHHHYYKRKKEPIENAFSILIPQNWQIEGGIFRVDPTAQGGSSQSIAAKLDFTVKKDNSGTVMIRWLPDILYFDTRNSPAGQMGLFPQGSNYQGMTVLNLMTAENFISQVAFPYAHPNAQNVQIIERKKLLDVAKKYGIRVKQAMPYSTMSYDAAFLKLKYQENGITYEETFITIIENWGQLGAGMWGNKETFLIRTPLGEFNDWVSTFTVIQNSVKLNLQWLVGEIRGQAARGEIAVNSQKEIERIGREITSHRQRTNAEIHNDMYLTLTEQEEYVNPYTNEIEVGTDQYKHRWINESGDVIYTENEDYDPNVDINLNRSDFKKSQIRRRFPN